VGGAATFLLSLCAAAADPVAGLAGAEEPHIYGGVPTETCAWPNAVHLSAGGKTCTATLIHPEIVTTAAHCVDAPSGVSGTVRFGENVMSPTITVQGTCYSNPGWNNIGPSDYAYCKLNDPVVGLQIAPAAYGCELPFLSAGREVVLVGYGATETSGSGVKHETVTIIQSISDHAKIGGGGTGVCHGDSGGPAYVRLAADEGGDDTWRAFAIASATTGGQCGNVAYYALIHEIVPWIEEHSGIDVTPCYDVGGNWQPGPDCGGHPTDYGTGYGTWSGDACQGPAIGFSAICGPPFGDDDEDPPSVTITSPPSGTRYDTNGASTVEVTITADADDGSGYGVAEVRLTVDGEEFANNTDSMEPFEWTLQMPPGAYMVGAIARDRVGLETAATPIAIGVDQDAPDTPDDDGGDGSDTSDGGSGDGDGDDGGFDGSDGGVPGSDRDSDEGCGCRAARSGGSFLAGLGLLVLASARRRRARAAH
jgi:hypothetical protein